MSLEPWAGWVLALLVVLVANLRTINVRARWPLALLALVLYIRYMTWRGLFTLEFAFPHVLVSLPLYLAEVYFLGQLLFFYLQIWRPTDPRSSPAQLAYFPWVDVFVPIYKEPLDVLRRTVVACLAMEYPKKRVYILDDGRRPEVEELARRLRCGYLTRPTNLHAKAGNINAALPRTSGELVALFDCDHAPVRSFLEETVGFFTDPKVAYVQTVQHFYNPDPFQRNLCLHRAVTNEQDLFFRVIMPGRDRYNAAFWTGSSAVFRRRALEELGGVLTDTLTEDFHTSLELQARGWRAVHLNRVLSAGLAPESYGAYLVQRLRWTQGMFQVLRRANPLWRRGLNLEQRLCYFASIYYFFFGVGRLFFLVAPLAFLLFGLVPLRATPLQLAIYFLPAYLSLYTVFPLLGRGWRAMISSEVYETAICFFQAPAALKALLFPRGGLFRVTPKGLEYVRPRLDWPLAAPQMGMVLLLALGFSLGVWRLIAGLPEDLQNATLINLGWAAYNSMLVIAAILVAREQPQEPRAYPLERQFAGELNADGSVVQGHIVQLSETGAQVQVPPDIVLPEVVAVKLYSRSGEVMELPSRVVEARRVGQVQVVDVKFFFLNAQQEEEFIQFLFCPPSAWAEGLLPPDVRPWKTLALFFSAPYRALKPLRARRPPQPWRSVSVPAMLWIGLQPCAGETVAANPDEVGIEMPEAPPVPVGTPVTVVLLMEGELFRLPGEVISWVTKRGRTRLRVSLKPTIPERYRWRQRLSTVLARASPSSRLPA